MFKDFFEKIVRYLVNNNYIGFRALNLVNYGVKYDSLNDRVYQTIGESNIYIIHPKHGVPNYKGRNTIEWLCEDIYYGNYRPIDSDIVIDIGTGYGHEIAWLKSKCNAKIICVEPNPEVFVALQMNLLGLKEVTLHNKFIGQEKHINFSLSTNYAGATSQGDDIGIRVYGESLDELLSEYSEIALLKLNIEGGELSLLETSDLSKIARIVVSCHDFRADRGEGEYFRTHKRVMNILKDKGFNIASIETNYFPTPSWKESVKFWIFAEK